MNPISIDQRKMIFREELTLLKEEHLISNAIYDKVLGEHQNYYRETNRVEIKTEVLNQPKIVVTKPPEPKIRKTPEQIRERNITWLLNLGVILLLIGGLYVATSNWETMSSWMKASAIGLVSGLFFGLAWVSKRVLHIKQTAFAFTVLGSLFLPIFLLSLGWFQLLGPYFSFTGEGRYIFGAISSYLLVPLYLFLAKRNSSRLIVWFGGIATTIGTAFFLTALHLDGDGFYFGMMLYHACLLISHFYIKEKPFYVFFSKELLLFYQASLVLTTAFMLLLFQDPIYYGMNIIITAILYLAMVFVTGHTHYHFVFTLFLVYGVYRLVENSVLLTVGPILYAIVGTVFLVLPVILKGEVNWKKIFSITSTVISFLAFVYISVESYVRHMGDPSIVMVISYIILAGNFYYLVFTLKKQWYSYVSSAFLVAALFQVVLLIEEVIPFDSFLPLFAVGFGLFTVFGYLVASLIRQSSRDVGLAVMLLPLLPSWMMFDWWEIGTMFALLTISFLLGRKIDKRTDYQKAINWLIPVCIGLSTAAFLEEGKLFLGWRPAEVSSALNFIVGSLILLIGKRKRPFFLLSQAFYFIGILYTFSFPTNDLLRVFILSGGIAMAYLLYKQTKEKVISYYVSICSLVSYLSLLYAMGENHIIPLWLEEEKWIIGGALLVGVAYLLKTRDRDLSVSYLYISHIYVVPSMLLTFFFYNNAGVWAYVIATLIYVISILLTSSDWLKNGFLFGSFTSLFIAIRLFFLEENWLPEYSFIVTSIILAIGWFISTKNWRDRTTYYLVPFSIIGMIDMLTAYPFEYHMYISLMVYGIGLLILLHCVKWDFLVIIPLLITFAGTIELTFVSNTLYPLIKGMILTGLGLATFIAGRLFYKELLVTNPKLSFSYIDSYTLISFFYALFLYTIEREGVMLQILPGLLIAAFLWMQQVRVNTKLSWIPKFLAGAYLLEPYFQLLNEIHIPALFEKEVYVLPFIAIGIFLQHCLNGKYSIVTQQIQWGILISVSLLLVQDGLQSNTVYDAIIVGTLSLISIVAGAVLRVKSYFFVGSGVLLLNVLLQTRPYWGNLPWWVYLLLAGSVLISVASYNEWNKQKKGRGETTKLEEFKKKIVLRLKTWK